MQGAYGDLDDDPGFHHQPDAQVNSYAGSSLSGGMSFQVYASGPGGDAAYNIANFSPEVGVEDQNVSACHEGCLHFSFKSTVKCADEQLKSLQRLVESLSSREEFAITVNLSGRLINIHKDKGQDSPTVTKAKLQVPCISSVYFSSSDASALVVEGEHLEGVKLWAFCAGQKAVEYLVPARAAAGSDAGQHSGSAAAWASSCVLAGHISPP